MEIHERIRLLRNSLKLSQTAFGEKLGVNRSVISNIESNVISRMEQKLPLIKLISHEFHVREQWILTGEGEMYDNSDKFSLEKFAERYNLSELELDILRIYFQLPKEIRTQVVEHFQKNLRPSEPTTAELEEQYKKMLSEMQSNTGAIASSTTEGTGKAM